MIGDGAVNHHHRPLDVLLQLGPVQPDAPVGDDLIHDHVRLRPRPGLEDIQREITSSQTRSISLPFHAGSRPAWVFTIAAAFFTYP
jgi:hypothetical protein